MSFQMLEIPQSLKNGTRTEKELGTSLGLPNAMKTNKIQMCVHTCMSTCVHMHENMYTYIKHEKFLT